MGSAPFEDFDNFSLFSLRRNFIFDLDLYFIPIDRLQGEVAWDKNFFFLSPIALRVLKSRSLGGEGG